MLNFGCTGVKKLPAAKGLKELRRDICILSTFFDGS